MFFTEIMVVYCENHKKCIHRLGEKFIVKVKEPFNWKLRKNCDTISVFTTAQRDGTSEGHVTSGSISQRQRSGRTDGSASPRVTLHNT
jgi:hypothetical protein